MSGQTKSCVRFRESWETIEHLRRLRDSSTPVSQSERASLNKAAMVFIVTAWEAYIEDVTCEAADHIADQVKSYNDLPNSIRSAIEAGVKANSPRWNVAHLVGDGWRDIVRRNAKEMSTGRAFNTPSPAKVKELLKGSIGLTDITLSWAWQNHANPGPANKLVETIGIRGDIVHTGQKPDGLNMGWIRNYGENICKIVDRTDGAVRDHACTITGVAMPDFTPVV